MIDNTKFSYAAGYIDGDGCFSIRKHRVKNRFKYISCILVVSTVLETMEWFQREFGGNILTKTPRPGHKVTYHFCLNGEKSTPFIEGILPFLVEKKMEAQVYLKFVKSRDSFEKDMLIDLITDQKENQNLVSGNLKNEFELTRNTIFPCLEDFSYLAGFIDAECCLGINRYRSKNRENFLYKILLQCNNTKAPVFKWLLERFGGQIHFIERKCKNSLWNNQLTWRICSSSLYSILDKILPFLKQKRPVCEELINFYKTTVPIKKTVSRNSPKFRQFYTPILEEREKIFHKVQSLNKKGVII